MAFKPSLNSRLNLFHTFYINLGWRIINQFVRVRLSGLGKEKKEEFSRSGKRIPPHLSQQTGSFNEGNIVFSHHQNTHICAHFA